MAEEDIPTSVDDGTFHQFKAKELNLQISHFRVFLHDLHTRVQDFLGAQTF